MALLALVSCESEMESLSGGSDPIALRGIRADIDNGSGTRAVAPLIDSIGKYDFLGTDKIVFTLIERTKRPIRPTFSYKDVVYSCLTADGNVSWKRDLPETDIFWSDGSEPHTFIGYILPHADASLAAASGFDWHHDKANDVYYGSIGNPANTSEIIDYTGAPEKGEDQKAPYSTEKLRKEDLLLTYDTEMQNEDAMAWVHFHHGLASIRVTVTITGYSTTGEDPDAKTLVTDMLVHNQPTMYKWNNRGFRAAPLVEADQSVLNSFDDWGGATPAWNQTKNMKLWQPREHHGVGASRTFIFYGITSPGEQDEVNMTFKVSYPDPLDPNHENPARLEKTYTATLQLPDSRKVEFRPGYCTSININLNHKDEKMTVGAEYMSWQNDDSPNEGSLRKNSTYLAYTDRSKITIIGDEHATADDATWLYQGTSGKIYDIYGNDGSSAHPFLISTADQLLSFAYEVKGTDRTSVTVKKEVEDSNGKKPGEAGYSPTYEDLTISSGFDFKDYHIKLDADITMQATMDGKGVTWQGIGDASHPFNGYFNGGFRHIRKLYGASFFNTVGEYGIVDHIFITDALGIAGSGSIAEKNLGIICGSHVEGDIIDETYTEYCGSIVGINEGVLIACSHIGDITGNSNTLGALLGKNDGIMVTCYNVGDAQNNATGRPAYAGVGDFTPRSIAYCCYYNGDFYNSEDYVLTDFGVIGHVAFPLTTSEMQSNKYVNQPAIVPQPSEGTNTGEITDPSVKHDIFFYHWSLNVGLNRAIQLLSTVYDANPQVPDNEDLIFHTEADRGGYLQIGVKKSQVQWLINHYADHTHQFQFIPGTYPKLQ